MKKDNLIKDLKDLHKQATTEDSHFYTAKLLGETIKFLEDNSCQVGLQVSQPNDKSHHGEQTGQCRMCFEDDRPIYYFDLYVTGSEGIWICEKCRTLITKNIREIRGNNLRNKLKDRKDEK